MRFFAHEGGAQHLAHDGLADALDAVRARRARRCGGAALDGDGRAPVVEVDAPAVAADAQPDLMTFNGIAHQYDHRPLTARVGERVRIWVLDAGPNRPSSLHVVGGQLDTVYAEGGYLLRRGRDAFGTRDGGSQALALQPAQGGFVELVLPEAGTYPVVTHVMADAERGAHALLRVTS